MVRKLSLILLVAIWAGCGAPPPPAPNGQARHEDRDSHGKGHVEKSSGEHVGHDSAAKNAMLMVATEPAPVTAGEPTKLKLMIHDELGGMLREFDITHEKRVHLIIVREGLDQFSHVHPELDEQGNITTTFTFPVGGKYRLFADSKPTGREPLVATATVDVEGDSQAAPPLVPDVPGEVTGDGLHASIAFEQPQVGGKTLFTFNIADKEGKPVGDLEPYLGAMGHLVVLSADGSRFVHSHPVESDKSETGEVIFATHFPSVGIYKGWGQFQRGGKVFTIPFVVAIPN